MAIIRIKISELPLQLLSQASDGLYTIGYRSIDGVNVSVKVSLLELKNALNAAVSAQNAANDASQSAAGARDAAITAIGTANTAAIAANNATNAAQAATDAATEATDAAREEIIIMEALRRQLVISAAMVPAIMELSYPAVLSIRNSGSPRISARLLPVYMPQNVLYLPAGGDAVTVLPDGCIVINRTGSTTIHVIPTAATHLYKTIQISIRNPYLRKVSGGGLRITSMGHLRIV